MKLAFTCLLGKDSPSVAVISHSFALLGRCIDIFLLIIVVCLFMRKKREIDCSDLSEIYAVQRLAFLSEV